MVDRAVGHRFRFVLGDAASGAAIEPGSCVQLDEVDRSHARVLRLTAGDTVELADGSGRVWLARMADDGVEVLAELPEPTHGIARPIELIAGVLVGGRFDQLVDGAVQSGATSIVPLAASRRELERIVARRERLQRIARAAAKQAKPAVLPQVLDPILPSDLAGVAPGILLDASASAALDLVLREDESSGPLRLLVGPAEGLGDEQRAELLERGWVPARIGPTIMRAELAAAVACAIAAMCLSAPPSERQGESLL